MLEDEGEDVVVGFGKECEGAGEDVEVGFGGKGARR